VSRRFARCTIWTLIGIAAAVASPAAFATTTFTPCSPTGVECATVDVPLDYSGVVPGTVSLAVRRMPAPAGPSLGTVIFFDGGPGGSDIDDNVRTRVVDGTPLNHYDEVVYDSRGVNLSSPLNCGSAATWLDCANSIGPARAFYHSSDSADDLEAVRQAIGVDKIAIDAVSYGAVVAFDYAARYPNHVQWLIFTSPILPSGWDPLLRASARAVPGVLRAICKAGCRGITSDPVADLQRLLQRLRSHPTTAVLIGPDGRRLVYDLGSDLLFEPIWDSDVDDQLRAQIPAALHAAASGDAAPLERLLGEAFGPGHAATGGSAFSRVVNHVTNCEETSFPWPRTTPPRLAAWPGAPGDTEPRAVAVANALAAEPAATYLPFSGLEVVSSNASTVTQCMSWPHAARPASLGIVGPPDVPTLVISGEDDVRTPYEHAATVAARFAHAQVAVIPGAGHGLSGTPPSEFSCYYALVAAFLAGQTVASTCPRGIPLFPPTPIPPTSLRRVAPYRHLAGTRGRVLSAVAFTLDDAETSYLASLARLEGTPATLSVGGLRGGFMTGSLTGFHMNRLVVVPGVIVTGTLDMNHGTAVVKVSAGRSGGTVKLTKSRITGRLGGVRFSLPRPKRPPVFARAARAGRRVIPPPTPSFIG
jgi:pimeloyl-ACP methyl ester carboxylesterase